MPIRDEHSRRDADIERGRERLRKGAEIGELPAVVDAARRESCRLDLAKFLVTYFPFSTGLSPFSADHQRVIARTQDCIIGGGRFVNAVYRGFAKSTISENALLWAILFGHRKFGGIFAAESDLAAKAINSIRTELSDNDLLFADFPEVCHPVRCLRERPSGATRRPTAANALTSAGGRTR